MFSVLETERALWILFFVIFILCVLIYACATYTNLYNYLINTSMLLLFKPFQTTNLSKFVYRQTC